MKIISGVIRESVNTFKYNHLETNYYYGSAPMKRYESPNISSPLNTKIYNEISETNLDIKESIKVQLNEDMGGLEGFRNLNDMFF